MTEQMLITKPAGQETRPDDVLVATDVTKHFGGLMALHDIDMSIHKGQIYSLIGPNGAGKTTFFNVIAGIFPPT